jgi:hypothetical protein
MSIVDQEVATYTSQCGKVFSVYALEDFATGECEGYDVWYYPDGSMAHHLNFGDILHEIPTVEQCLGLLEED